MIIRPHNQPGAYDNREGWLPLCAWPEDCTVQWGDVGLVVCREKDKENYLTAFFEAFPVEPRTFIRGEGKTIVEAEANAFAKLERYQACAGHEFEMGTFLNGAGICKHCRMFSSKAIEPIYPCHTCGELTWHSHDQEGRYFCKPCYDTKPIELQSESEQKNRALLARHRDWMAEQVKKPKEQRDAETKAALESMLIKLANAPDDSVGDIQLHENDENI